MELVDQIALVIENVEDPRIAAQIILGMVPRALGSSGGRPRKPLSSQTETPFEQTETPFEQTETPFEPLFAAPSKSLDPDLGSSGSEPDPDTECAELKDESPVFLEFLVAGKVKLWALRQAHLAKYQAAFPDLDCESQFRKAALWCECNAPKRKTAKGMPRFLQNWLDNAQNRGEGRKPQQPTTSTAPAANDPVAALYARIKARGLGSVDPR